MQAGFLGRAFDEAAALAVLRQIKTVEVEPVAKAQTQRDFERVSAECFFEPTHAILAPVERQKPVFTLRHQDRL